jgi:hypothetical protein
MLSSCYNRLAMVSGLVRLTVVASAVFAASCSLAVDPDQVQCEVSADCAAIGFPDSDCVNAVCAGSIALGCGSVDWPAPASGSAQVSIRAADVSNQPAPGIEIYACRALSSGDCTGDALAGPITTATDGTAKFAVGEGFRGHFFAPTADFGLQAPYILNMHPPPDSTKAHTLFANLTVTSIAFLEGIASTLDGITVTPDQALLFFSTRDCQGELLSGVSVQVGEAPGNLQVVYLGTNGAPDQSLSETGTGAYGRGVLINIPPGRLPVRGFQKGVKNIHQTMLLEANKNT